MNDKLLKKLNDRVDEGTFRSLSSFAGYIDFFSNDYLGASTLDIKTELKGLGSTGSRLISGSNDVTFSCEKKIANFFNVEKALVFNSGYDANIGFFSSVPQKGDTVIYDEYIHASIRDGIRLSFSDSYSFKHNDLNDLKRKLSISKGAIYVSIESLYSMGGDISPMMEIALLCKEYNAYLIVDEAHAVGVFGDKGRGLIDSLGLRDFVFARIITFGKAFGYHGACVLTCKDLNDYLINFSRSFIYTTALPKESYARIERVLFDDRLNNERIKLNVNISYFRKLFKNFELSSDQKSPIQLLKLGNISKTKKVALAIQKNQIAIKPIFPPTVPLSDVGIRICLHSYNTMKEIDLLYRLLSSV